MGKSEARFSGMLFSGVSVDPEKSNQLSLGEKRKLVHEVIEFSDDAPQVLKSLSRKELLEIICAELGKERTYNGHSKSRMIDSLLDIISKNSKKKTESVFKKQKKQESPVQLGQIIQDEKETVLCKNLACKAIIKRNDAFCKRCSCCLCYGFDDNKDPSLWLTCDSDSPYEGESCGFSCHFNCAANHKRSGILKSETHAKLDGCFACISCGKVNGLMRTWRKQMVAVKEARRVDILCLRVSIGKKILQGTKIYIELSKNLESAAKMLENEVGPLDCASKIMDRGIVNRLSCGTEVQRLCFIALESFDSMSSDVCSYVDHKEPQPMFRICFEKLSPTSVTVVLEYEDHQFKDLLGCKLWHRKSTSKDYLPEATCIVLRSQKKFDLTNLDPSTKYSCKVSFFSNTNILGTWEAKWITPAANHSLVPKQEPQVDLVKKKVMSSDSVSENTNTGHISYPPPTPVNRDGISRCLKFDGKKETKEDDYEYSVRMVRSLEHEGHLDKDFRVKFLTWFSLKATIQERRVVSVFVNTFNDDPKCLAAQLIDSFEDRIGGQKKCVPQHGFCTRFWH